MRDAKKRIRQPALLSIVYIRKDDSISKNQIEYEN